MQLFCESLSKYKRLKTKEVQIGGLKIGNNHPIAIQTMTTADTMDTDATIAESIRCIKAGAQLVRITAPSKKEAHNLKAIKDGIRAAGYDTPLVADIHFTPNAAEIAAKIVEKVRVNPGNYADKKKFETHEYTDASYQEELDRIREKFIPLVSICKEHGTAMRIGTNHGSLSDRIMSRFGDTAIGMVESALEFLRIARSENYHNIVLSMKSSNTQVMVQAYRLLVQKMNEEFGECYPLHLGVTEAGDGEDGRIKSAVGIGTLLKDGLGDTIRVSLTEDPEFELPVCRDLINECTTDTPLNPLSRGEEAQENLLNWKNNIIPYNKNLKEKATELRNNPTDQEHLLWQKLKGKKLKGYDFHRQKPLNEFIVDFFCQKLQLVLEIDGSIHDNEENKAYDASREGILNDLKLNVIRFSNAEVETKMHVVIEKIEQYASAFEQNNLSVIKGINPLSKLPINHPKQSAVPPLERGLGGVSNYDPFNYRRRKTTAVQNIGGTQVPVVVGDFGKIKNTTPESLQSIGYTYNAADDKWNVSDFAADYLFIEEVPDFKLPGTLRVITWHGVWKEASDKTKVFPYLTRSQYLSDEKSDTLNFVDLGAHESLDANFVDAIKKDPSVVLVMYSAEELSMKQLRAQMLHLVEHKIDKPVIFIINSKGENDDQHLIHYATEAGALLLDGFGDGLILGVDYSLDKTLKDVEHANQNTFGILQATRVRISKTEYISCPSCGRTLFDLQETTAKIRARTNHLKGVKIGIMGCIVNGPGEMADADFGYVGSGVGKITLYKGQEVVKRSIPSDVAVDELINLIKENDAWVEPSLS